jgi:phosphatidylserine/phosphatidylglycerophosphate/cardiolipin synthase-like enzyme
MTLTQRISDTTSIPAAQVKSKANVEEAARLPERISTSVVAPAIASKNVLFHAADAAVPMAKDAGTRAFWMGMETLDKQSGTVGSKMDDVIYAAAMAKTKDPAAAQEVLKAAGKLLRLEIHRVLHEGYPGWMDLNNSVSAAVRASNKGAKPTPVSSPAFQGEFEKLMKGKFFKSGAAELYGFGRNRDALDARLQMISSARSRIDCAVWKIYGDDRGAEFVQALIDKKAANPNMPISVMVDGNVAEADPSSEALLKKLETAGISVMRFKDANHPSSGMHFKGLYVDTDTAQPQALVGGRNCGRDYMDPNMWRDTDIQFDGQAAIAGKNELMKLWNFGLTNGPLETKTSGGRALAQREILTDAQIEGAFVLSDGAIKTLQSIDAPGPLDPQSVVKGLLKTIDGAETDIRIAQAYFCDIPAVMEALQRARDRGVRIQIFANSIESNDHPELMRPINKALQKAINMGAEVYVKTGPESPPQTLHSKFLMADGAFVAVGSWNQHGRSMMLEAEGMNFRFDEELAMKLTAEFELDKKFARRVTDMEVAANPLMDVLEYLGAPLI